MLSVPIHRTQEIDVCGSYFNGESCEQLQDLATQASGRIQANPSAELGCVGALASERAEKSGRRGRISIVYLLVERVLRTNVSR
jgi:hypothetical protein